MEVFRTDSSGKSYTDERLFRLILNIKKIVPYDFFENVISINDHKGLLIINLKKDIMDVEFYYCVFYTFWSLENECSLEILINNKLVKNS